MAERKTAAERAAEAYAASNRKVQRLAARQNKLQAQLDAAKAEHDAAVKQAEYLGQNPNLARP